MEQQEQQNQQQNVNNDNKDNHDGGTTTKNERGTIHCITIIGQIEGHNVLPPGAKSTKYEHIIPQLVAVEESPEVDGLLVVLHTVGGDVEAGLALAEMVSSMKKPVVSLVLGGGHSIGVPLAVAAKFSFIAPSAAMTIHPVRINGTVIGVSQTFNYFMRIQERVVSFVCRNCSVSVEKFRQMMLNTGELAADIGTVVEGEEAVNCGLIDKVGGLKDALEKLYELIEEEKIKKNPEKSSVANETEL